MSDVSIFGETPKMTWALALLQPQTSVPFPAASCALFLLKKLNLLGIVFLALPDEILTLTLIGKSC
jgi:hypothetical protein